MPSLRRTSGRDSPLRSHPPLRTERAPFKVTRAQAELRIFVVIWWWQVSCINVRFENVQLLRSPSLWCTCTASSLSNQSSHISQICYEYPLSYAPDICLDPFPVNQLPVFQFGSVRFHYGSVFITCTSFSITTSIRVPPAGSLHPFRLGISSSLWPYTASYSRLRLSCCLATAVIRFLQHPFPPGDLFAPYGLFCVLTGFSSSLLHTPLGLSGIASRILTET